MADRLPSVAQITKAEPALKQAATLQIDAMDSFAPDHIVDTHRRQFLYSLEQMASRLGMRLVPVGPRLAVDNDDMPISMGR